MLDSDRLLGSLGSLLGLRGRSWDRREAANGHLMLLNTRNASTDQSLISTSSTRFFTSPPTWCKPEVCLDLERQVERQTQAAPEYEKWIAQAKTRPQGRGSGPFFHAWLDS